MRIVLNPGHGPKNTGAFDPGAVGPSRIREADVNLAIANLLKPLLETAGIGVEIFRDGDLQDVTDFANRIGADYFLSIHCNSFSDANAHGTETYVYSTESAAIELAKKVQAAVVGALGTFDRGVKTANFHVLRKTNMPSLLVELAFISNPKEEKNLSTPALQSEVALAIADAVISVLKPNQSADEVKVYVNNKVCWGKLIEGKTYIPARAVLEELGHRVEWKNGAVFVDRDL